MALPTKKKGGAKSIQDLSVLIYGGTKIGKSTLCADAYKAIFLATEAGLNLLNVYQVPINKWEDLLEACVDLANGEHDFKTIIIDTIDIAYKMCDKYICDKMKITHATDLTYGKGYSLINNEFIRVINRIALLPYGLIMISHSHSVEVKTRIGKTTKIIPTLPNSVGAKVKGLVDMILYIDINVIGEGENQEEVRVIRTKPTPYYDAGDRTGKLPETINLNWKAFTDAFTKTQGER